MSLNIGSVMQAQTFDYKIVKVLGVGELDDYYNSKRDIMGSELYINTTKTVTLKLRWQKWGIPGIEIRVDSPDKLVEWKKHHPWQKEYFEEDFGNVFERDCNWLRASDFNKDIKDLINGQKNVYTDDYGILLDYYKLKDYYERHRPKESVETISCFITTAVCDNFHKPDDCYELLSFRNFRDNWLSKQPDGNSLINEYYHIAPLIVEKINSCDSAKDIYNSIWSNYLSRCLKFIEIGDYKQCKNLYTDMVYDLKNRFL